MPSLKDPEKTGSALVTGDAEDHQKRMQMVPPARSFRVPRKAAEAATDLFATHGLR